VTRKPHHAKQVKKQPHPVVTELRRIRRERGISQLKIASMLGIDRQRIYKLELGWTHHPSITLIARYAEILGVEITVSTPGDT